MPKKKKEPETMKIDPTQPLDVKDLLALGRAIQWMEYQGIDTAQLKAKIKVSDKRKEKTEADFEKETHRCNKCGETKPVLSGFGLRTVRGKLYKQPWCYACRTKNQYNNAARKNRTT